MKSLPAVCAKFRQFGAARGRKTRRIASLFGRRKGLYKGRKLVSKDEEALVHRDCRENVVLQSRFAVFGAGGSAFGCVLACYWFGLSFMLGLARDLGS